MTVAYLTNDTSTGGIEKWTSNGAGVWTKTATLALSGTSANQGARGLTVDWSNPNAPVLYATTTVAETGGAGGNKLVKVVDNGTTFSSLTVTTLATAGTNQIYRGVDQALLPSVWTSNSSGNWASTANTTYNTTIGAVTTASKDWSTNLVDGTNVAFQKVNAANVSLANNSALTNISSINFNGGGTISGGQNTAYTLTGNALSFSGTAATSAIGTFTANSTTYTSVLANNSGVTQTVGIPLTLGAANQAIRAVSGDLAINGTLANGGNTLTVGGSGNTTFGSSATISGSGGLTKVEAGTLTLSGNNTYSGGTTVSQGTLLVTNSAGSGTGSGNVTVSSGATLGGSGTVSGATTLNGGTIGSAANTLSLGSTLATTGASTLTANSTVNVSGGTTITSGSFTVNGTLGGGIAVGGNTLNGSGTVNGTTTVNGGTIGGTLNLATLVATGSSSIASTVNVAGGTSVSSGGTFTVNGTLASAVTITSGATLKGSGNVTGATTIQSGGFLAPGNSPGLLSFNSTLILSGTTTMEILGTGTDRGLNTVNGYDAINTGAGLLTYGGNLTMSFGSTTSAGTTYDLFQIGSGGQTSNFSSVTIGGTYAAVGNLVNLSGVWSGDDIANNLRFTFTQSTGDLVVTAIPEPSTYAALAGLGMVGFALYRRRRQHAAKRAA
jgi:hypothetical protein